MDKIQLVKEGKTKLIRGQSYMAFVKVTPLYEEGNPVPKLLMFNELIPKKQKEEKGDEQKDLSSKVRGMEEI